ncbi:4-phosphopantoate--beta-alanine ligase [Lacunimicrobium album]
MTQTTSKIDAVRISVLQARREGKRIACVPTMGALHEGHLSLIDEAKKLADYVVVTVFVNPTQFGPHEDFHKYPRPIEKDIAMCSSRDADLIFNPDVETMYPSTPGAKTFIEVPGLSEILEGAIRPGHFRGVATVVMKLFQIVMPDVACFGAKDFQQLAVIKQMVRDLNSPIQIVGCPTIREADGLAMSSRNAYLSPEQRAVAIRLYEAMIFAKNQVTAGHNDLTSIMTRMAEIVTRDNAMTLDYAILANPTTLETLTQPQPEMVALVAARNGTTRLIDNMMLTAEK